LLQKCSTDKSLQRVVVDESPQGAASIASMLHTYLLQEFERRTQSNANYSLRAFARDLEIHSGTLSSILNQRRAVGAKTLAHIMKKLPLSATEKKKILSAMMMPTASTAEDRHFLDEDVLSVIKDWEHYAILAYLQLGKGKKTPGDIAKALRLPQVKFLRAITNLEKTGLVKRDGNRLECTHISLGTSRGIPSPALREAHTQYIDKAKTALNDFPVDERDITGTTLAVSSKNLPKAKDLIRQFRRELSELLEQGETDEVYRLNVQLFPLTYKKDVEVLR
jgi:DNA-binding MarR family transcriptional regulator/plasmid maintenance system antidote protein VapI